MITYTPPPIDGKLEDQMRLMCESGAPVDEVIGVMRRSGLSKIPSIKLLRKYLHLSSGDAKNLVHLSPVWADARDNDDVLHHQAEAAAQSVDRRVAAHESAA